MKVLRLALVVILFTLPTPGIAKQVLPNELISRLPPTPRGHERIVVDGRILRVEIATEIVHGVLTDIVFR